MAKLKIYHLSKAGTGCTLQKLRNSTSNNGTNHWSVAIVGNGGNERLFLVDNIKGVWILLHPDDAIRYSDG